MVLGKLPVPGRPTNLDYSSARAYCACSGCGWGLFEHFTLVYHFSFLSPSLWETARYRLKYCLKGPLNPNQTNQLLLINLVGYGQICLGLSSVVIVIFVKTDVVHSLSSLTRDFLASNLFLY